MELVLQLTLEGASLVLTSELTAIPVSTTLSSIGFTTTAGATSAVTGTITIYLPEFQVMQLSKQRHNLDWCYTRYD